MWQAPAKLVFATFFLHFAHFCLFFSVRFCGPPDVGQHTELSNITSEYTYQHTVGYSCSEGYEEAYGDAERTCVASGLWSGSPLVCTGEEMRWFLMRLEWRKELMSWEYLAMESNWGPSFSFSDEACRNFSKACQVGESHSCISLLLFLIFVSLHFRCQLHCPKLYSVFWTKMSAKGKVVDSWWFKHDNSPEMQLHNRQSSLDIDLCNCYSNRCLKKKGTQSVVCNYSSWIWSWKLSTVNGAEKLPEFCEMQLFMF